MALSARQARSAVEIGALATGSLGFAFPRFSARLLGTDPTGGASTSLVRMVGARSITYGALLMNLEDDDDVELALIAGAAAASADTVAALVGAARGRRTWPGALLTAVVSGTIAGLACWALTAES
jgi:CDP-diglyceride synthetase